MAIESVMIPCPFSSGLGCFFFFFLPLLLIFTETSDMRNLHIGQPPAWGVGWCTYYYAGHQQDSL